MNKCVIYEGVITKNVCEENKVIATCVTSVCVCSQCHKFEWPVGFDRCL